jgi:hypothetical protein
MNDPTDDLAALRAERDLLRAYLAEWEGVRPAPTRVVLRHRRLWLAQIRRECQERRLAIERRWEAAARQEEGD